MVDLKANDRQSHRLVGRIRQLAEVLSSRLTVSGHSPESLLEGSYTTLLVRKGHRVLDFDLHLLRLTDPAAGGDPVDASSIAARLLETLETQQLDTARVRLTRSRSRLFASLAPHDPLPARLYERGVSCETVALTRSSPDRKDTRFLAAAASAREGFGADVHEGLMTTGKGALLEGLSSNFFGVLGGELRTARDGVLPGLTRRRVLELAADLVPIRLEPIGSGERRAIGEAFLTSASRGVLPVVTIDAVPIGDGLPGAVTQRLGELLEVSRDRDAVALADIASPGLQKS